MKKHFLLLLGLAFIHGASVLAEERAVIAVENAWARESPPMVTTGVAYMTLTNGGGQVDRLVAVSGEVAETIELHTHLMENDVMMMRPVESVAIEPGEAAVFESGGLHIMLIDLKAPLVAGGDFPLTLHFEKAGEIVVDVAVKKN